MSMSYQSKGKRVKAPARHVAGVTCVLLICLIAGCKKDASARRPSSTDNGSHRVATSSTAEASQCPVEYIGGAVLKLGYLKAGEPHTRELRVVNRSRESVGVRGVRTNCNCVKAKYEGSRVLAPGGEGSLSIIVEPTPQENTWQKRYIMLELDNGTIAAACIWYRSAVGAYVTPEVVSLTWREGEDLPNESVFIHSWGERECTILGWNSDNGYVDLSVRKQDREQTECIISLKPGSPVRGNDKVHILTNKEWGSQCDIDVKWQKRPGGIVIPPVIYLTKEQCGETKKFTILDASNTPIPASDVAEIVCDKTFTVVPLTTEPSQECWGISMNHAPSFNEVAGLYAIQIKTRRYGVIAVHVYVSQANVLR